MMTKVVAPRLLFFGTFVVLMTWVSASPSRLQAQACSPAGGNNLVYGYCSGSLTTQFGSTAYIDLSAATTNGDICKRINTVLTTIGFKSGTLIDARGFTPSNPQGCLTDPFVGVGKSSIVLLPVGTITLSKAWAVPDQTQLIGQGPGQTILQAISGTNAFSDAYVFTNTTTGYASNPAVIHMGVPNTSSPGSSLIVFSVRLSHFTVDGNRQSISSSNIDGIDNNNAEEQSYVDDVTIQNVLGNGLYLSTDPDGPGDGAADHSGPYTNIVVQQTSGSAAAATTCVNITAGVQPRGIHGISCLGDSGSNGTNAVLLYGSSTTIEDARIDGFKNGIYIVGSSGSTDLPNQADLLFNISGTDSIGSISNLINIDNTGTGNSPLNIAVMGASLTTAASTPCSIDDQTTSTCLPDQFVGMYLLGQPVSSSNITYGYSRFTTSKNFATWVVGKTTGSITNKTCSANGSIFTSNTGTGGNIWGCVSGTWQ